MSGGASVWPAGRAQPSLLASVKLHANTYLQMQLAEWIPLGGDTDYQGGVLHIHASLNHVLYRIGG